MDLRKAIRTIPDYPKPGIQFRDITTLLTDARAFRRAVDELVQPFAGMLDIPLRLYVGELSGAAAAGGLALQAFWTLTLIALGRWALSRDMRRLEVQGG